MWVTILATFNQANEAKAESKSSHVLCYDYKA